VISKFTALVSLSVLVLVGCGGGSQGTSTGTGGSGTTPQNVVVSGQWDAIATPSGANSTPTNYYANVTNQGSGAFFAASGNVVACLNDDCFPESFASAQGYAIAGTTTGTQVQITLTGQGGYTATLSGTVSADGTTMSGTYTDSSTGDAVATGPGSWVAQKKQSVSGSYSGTYNSTVNPSTIPVTITSTITQDQTYALTGAATVSNSTCFTSLTFGAGSRAVGGALYLLDSNDGIYVTVVPNEDGTLNSGNSFYSVYRITSGACSTDTGVGTVTKQ
jgi:hypothetical protein